MATGDWSAIEALPEAQRLLVLYYRVYAFAGQGKLSEATEALDRWVALGPTKADDLYNLACGHGVLVAALRKASPEPNEDEQRREAQHVAAALATLRQSISAGYSDFKHMATDTDLATLRDLPEFQSMLPK